jgi:peptidoglycan-associated lipoprotein
MKAALVRTLIIVLCFLAFPGCARKVKVNPAEATAPPSEQTVQLSDREIPEATSTGEEAVVESSLEGSGGAVLESVYFDFDSYTLTPAAREVLYRNAQWLKAHPQKYTTIEGHTDERGSDAYNIALGENRARAAMKYLLTLGIAQERLSVISYGEEKPADSGHDETAWAKNRRAGFM